jgi:uncharacterized protein (UPF0332 family)
MIETEDPYWGKAEESLAGAESEFTNGRYNNCANRCYYSCFQAAVVALKRAGIRPRGSSGQWSHDFMPAQFDGLLIGRRKLYATDLRGVLARNYGLRAAADYEDASVSRAEAARALQRARTFMGTIRAKGNG